MESVGNIKASSFEKNPLLTAVENGDSKLVQKLIKNGADIDLADSNGVTPTHLAAYYCNTEILPLLIADSRIHGTRLTRQDANNKSALDYVFFQSIPNYKESPEKCDPNYTPKPRPRLAFGAVDVTPQFTQRLEASLHTCLRYGGEAAKFKAFELEQKIYNRKERLEANLIKPKFLENIIIEKPVSKKPFTTISSRTSVSNNLSELSQIESISAVIETDNARSRSPSLNDLDTSADEKQESDARRIRLNSFPEDAKSSPSSTASRRERRQSFCNPFGHASAKVSPTHEK